MDILKNITLAKDIKIGDTCTGIFSFDENEKYGSYKNMVVTKIKETKTGVKVFFSGTYIIRGEERPIIDYCVGFRKSSLPFFSDKH